MFSVCREGKTMARERNDSDKEISRKFASQGKALNRKRYMNAVGGIILLVLIIAALRFTPYRDVPTRILDSAKDFIKELTSGTSAPAEPDPKYW